MTTSTYLVLAELADKVFTLSDLANYGAQSALQVGRHLVHYTPRADQPLSLDRPIEAFADKQPANDNEPSEDVSPAAPEPAIALTKTAAAERFAEKARNLPGVERVLHREALFQARFDHAGDHLAHAPTFFTGRSRLKAMDFNQPAPKSIAIASRPFVEDWLAHNPQPKSLPKLKIDAAA